MKKFIIIPCISLLSATFAVAGNTVLEPDTVFSARNVTTAILTESPTGVALTIQGADDDEHYFDQYTADYAPDAVVTSWQTYRRPWTYSANEHSYWDITIGGIHFGFVDALGAPAAMDQQMGRSFELGIDECLGFGWHNKGFTTKIGAGIGVNWRNYRLTGDTRYLLSDGMISLGDYPEGTTPQFSNLKVFTVQFPIYWSQVFPSVRPFGKHSLGMRFAVNLNWNSHASLTTRYLLPDGYRAKESTKQVGQRPFSVDLQLSLFPFDWIGFYVKYSPMDVLKDGRGPSFSTLSTGVTLCF